MQIKLWFGALATVAALSAGAMAQAPAGSTGQCKDGTYSTAAKKAGACGGHKGVQTWYAESNATPAPVSPAKTPRQTSPSPTAAPITAPTPASAPAPVQKTSPAQASAPQSSSPAASRAQAPGGGPGMVWVNTTSKVYHCSGTKSYSTTKHGKYLSEAEAKAEGDRPDHGKPLSTVIGATGLAGQASSTC